MSRSVGRGSWPRRAWLARSVGPRRPTSSQLSQRAPRAQHVHVTRRTTRTFPPVPLLSSPAPGNEGERETEKNRKKKERGERENRAGPDDKPRSFFARISIVSRVKNKILLPSPRGIRIQRCDSSFLSL